MSRRTQITLSEAQYERLRDLSRDSGQSMSELIRRALDRTYGAAGNEALTATFGGWRDRRWDGERYVERIRMGMAGRLRRAGGGAR